MDIYNKYFKRNQASPLELQLNIIAQLFNEMLCSLKHKNENQIKTSGLENYLMRREHAHVISGGIIGYKIAYIVLISQYSSWSVRWPFGKTGSHDEGTYPDAVRLVMPIHPKNKGILKRRLCSISPSFLSCCHLFHALKRNGMLWSLTSIYSPLLY